MIKNSKEYAETRKRYEGVIKLIGEYRKDYYNQDYTCDEIKNIIDPLLSFAMGLKENIEEYEERREKWRIKKDGV